MTMYDLKLRLPGEAKNYLAARATAQARSMNAELNAILRVMMQADPVHIHLTENIGFFLLGNKGDPAAFGAFYDRNEALTEAKRLIASMPPGAAHLFEKGKE